VPVPAKKIDPARKEDLPRLWADLASANAPRAWRAGQTLSASGPLTVPFLARRLAPARAAGTAKLLTDLESDDFIVRENATRRLVDALKQGSHEAEFALRELMRGKPSLDAYRRAERLLHSHTTRPLKYTAEELRHIRAVAVLEQIGSREAVGLLKRLASGAPAVLTSEARASLGRLCQR
jgi:hypothetical protein